MAQRYSGQAIIAVAYSDKDSAYKCRVGTPEGSVSVTVNASPELARTKAADSPEAYDEIAHAALSFAEDELANSGISLAEYALFEPDGSGWTVTRTKDASNEDSE